MRMPNGGHALEMDLNQAKRTLYCYQNSGGKNSSAVGVAELCPYSGACAFLRHLPRMSKAYLEIVKFQH